MPWLRSIGRPRHLRLALLLSSWLGCSSPSYYVALDGDPAEKVLGGGGAMTPVGGHAQGSGSSDAEATIAGSTAIGAASRGGAVFISFGGLGSSAGAAPNAGGAVTSSSGTAGTSRTDADGAPATSGGTSLGDVGGGNSTGGIANAGTASNFGGTASNFGGTASNFGGTASNFGGTASNFGGIASNFGGTASNFGGIANAGTASNFGGTANGGGGLASGSGGLGGATQLGGAASAAGGVGRAGGSGAGGASNRGGGPATAGNGGSAGARSIGGSNACPNGALLCDDFESGSAKWEVLQGTWSISLDGSNVYAAALGANEARTSAGVNTWSNYTVTARLKLLRLEPDRRIYLAARFVDANNWYGAAFYNGSAPALQIRKKVAGSSSTLATTPYAWVLNRWYSVSFRVSGSTLTFSVDGTVVLTTQDASFSGGRIALLADRSQSSFDDVTVMPP